MHTLKGTICWWKKSCTTQGVRKGGVYRSNNAFSYPLSGARFFPSTVPHPQTPGFFPQFFRLRSSTSWRSMACQTGQKPLDWWLVNLVVIRFIQKWTSSQPILVGWVLSQSLKRNKDRMSSWRWFIQTPFIFSPFTNHVHVMYLSCEKTRHVLHFCHQD